MSTLLMLAGVVLAAVAQVTVAPLFPLGSAVPDLLVATLVVVSVFAGPRRAMVAVPLGALLLSFGSGRSAALLLIAYLPLLPLAAFLQEANVPLTRFLQSLAAAVVTGAWARTVLALGAMTGGADPQLGTLVLSLLLPGVFLDALVVGAAYLPWKVARLPARPLSLARTGYYT